MIYIKELTNVATNYPLVVKQMKSWSLPDTNYVGNEGARFNCMYVYLCMFKVVLGLLGGIINGSETHPYWSH